MALRVALGLLAVFLFTAPASAQFIRPGRHVAGATNTSVPVNSARLDPTTLNFAGNQQVPGGLTVNVPVTAVDQTGGPGVDTITASPLAFTGPQGGVHAVPSGVRGDAALITVGVPPGFDAPSNCRQITATVGP